MNEQVTIIEEVTRVAIVTAAEVRSVTVVEAAAVGVVAIAEQGPVGPPGTGGAATGFEQTFPSPALTWLVNHNLGKYPLVTVLTSGGAEVEAEIVHASLNQFTVYFAAPLAGRVRCL